MTLATIRQLVADDAHALTFQTFGQYRTALLKAIDQASPNPAPVTTTAEDAQEVAADLRKLIDSAPASIWLDLGEDFNAPPETTFRDLQEVTWSEDNATGVGIKYVRAPVAVATSDAERAAFERWLPVIWSRASYQDDEGERIYHDDWVQGAWCMWNHLRTPALPIDFKQATDQGGWLPLSTAPDGIRVLLGPREAPVVGIVRQMPEWADEQEPVASVLHYNGTVLVAGYHCSEWHSLPGAAPTLLGVADGDAVGGKSGGEA
jgi:hypothetical protein